MEYMKNSYIVKKNFAGSGRALKSNSLLNSQNAASLEIPKNPHSSTQKMTFEKCINCMIYYDNLTKVPNKLGFHKFMNFLLNSEENQKLKFSVLTIDIDNFSEINESLGFDIGDNLLIEIVRRLKTSYSEKSYFARTGGDEFSLLLVDIYKHTDVNRIAQNIINNLKRIFTVKEEEIYLTYCMGISTFPKDGYSVQEIVQKSDIAMYQAKENGSDNYVFFKNRLITPTENRYYILNSLKKAMIKDEFYLYYQPQINVSTGYIESMEALLRWKHCKLGLIPPSEFIPIAEKDGLIVSIGEWVLRTACVQNKYLQSEGYTPTRVAVNISPKQLQMPDFYEKVVEILK